MPTNLKFTMLRLTASILLSVMLHGSARAQTEIRWNWRAGQQLEVVFQQNTRTTTTVNKRPIQMNIDSRLEATWRVLNVDTAGAATIEQRIDRMTLILKTPEKPPLDYDSKEKRHSTAVRPTAEAVAPLLDLPIRIDVTASGQITNVHLDDKAEAAFKKSGAGARVPALFTKAGFTSVVQQTAPKLPKEPVAKGDTWKSTHEFNSAFGLMTQENEYEFVGPTMREEQQLEQIKISGQLRVLQAKADARGELKSQSMTGEMLFDKARGLIRESTITQQLGTERPYRGTVIKVESLSTLKMTLRAKAAK